MKIKPAKLPGSVVMEMDDRDSERLSKSAATSPFRLKKILVPVDFSDCSKKGLQYALPLARQFDAEIILLHVVSTYHGISGVYDSLLEADLCRDAARKLKTFANEFVPLDIPTRIETRYGAQADEIVSAAKKQEADLIVISTHGRAGIARALAGSVAEHVVRWAGCPVLVVREHEHEFVQDHADPATTNHAPKPLNGNADAERISQSS